MKQLTISTLRIASMITAMSLSTLTMAATPAADTFVSGTDYTVIANPGKPEKAGAVEVREFFWYGCPHCFKLEPSVVAWRKTKPADVNFILTPAAMNPTWEQNARGFYAVDLLGMADKTHEAMFSQIHDKQARLFDQASIAAFYATQGVDVNKFNGLYNSFAVSGKIAQSKALAIKYQLDGVPALVVNGKYVVRGEDARSFKVVDYLVAKERKLMPKTKRAA